jgi:hypothetical protein
LARPTKKEAMINEIKALSFAPAIKTSNKKMLAIKINRDISRNGIN